MTISAERREELGRYTEFYTDQSTLLMPVDELRTLLHDSARLEGIERQVRGLADDMDQHMTEMRQKSMDSYREGRADTAGYYGYELRAIVDTGHGEGGEG